MSETHRCEPPKPWVNGWHCLEQDGRQYYAYWWNTLEREWAWVGTKPSHARGYRYVAPVTPPAVVAALVAALEGLVMACELPGDHCEVEQALPTARAALAAYRESVVKESLTSPPPPSAR